jgi:hypothetical protein
MQYRRCFYFTILILQSGIFWRWILSRVSWKSCDEQHQESFVARLQTIGIFEQHVFDTCVYYISCFPKQIIIHIYRNIHTVTTPTRTMVTTSWSIFHNFRNNTKLLVGWLFSMPKTTGFSNYPSKAGDEHHPTVTGSPCCNRSISSSCCRMVVSFSCFKW